MTNSKSFDNCSFVTGKMFVMTYSTDMLTDSIEFVICKIAPDILPFDKQYLVTRGMRSQPGSFMFVMGSDRADLAAVSALALPGTLTWLGIQQRTILFPELVRVVYSFNVF